MTAGGNPNDPDRLADELARLDEALRGHRPAGNLDDASQPSLAGLQDHLKVLQALHERWPDSAADQDTGRDPSTGADSERHPHREATPLPHEFGRFQVQAELGRGGHGAVFLAFDPQLQRLVALKIPLRTPLVDPRLRERFRQEGRAAAGLEHPNIVTVFEAGEVGPIAYIASAFCPGKTLAHWLRERQQPVGFREAAGLIATLSDAVQHAHSRSVLHRDLKPGNVLLSPLHKAEGEQAEAADRNLTEDFIARITDFGLAKLIDDQADQTRSGDIVGTPTYMAPEQASGKSHQVGPAADVYSLGAMLYELLTGRPPFQGDSHVEVLIQARAAEPIAPARLRPRTPRDLQTICRKCLEKNPQRRYPSAEALVADLRNYLAGKPIAARPVGPMARTWRWARRQPLVATLLLLLMVTVVAGLIGVSTQWYRAEERAQAAETAYGQAAREGQRARHSLLISLQTIDQFCSKVSDSPSLLRGTPGAQQLRRQLLRQACSFYQELLQKNDGPELQFEMAQAWERLGTLLAQLGDVDRAEQSGRRAVESLQELRRRNATDPDYTAALARAFRCLGTTYLTLDRHEDAFDAFDESLKLHERLISQRAMTSERTREYAVLKHGIAMAKSETGQTPVAVQLGSEALELLDEAATSDPSSITPQRLATSLRVNLGHWLLDTQQQAEAEQMYQAALASAEAMQLHPEAGPGECFELVRACNSLGLVAVRKQQHEQALAMYTRALDAAARLQVENPDVHDFIIEHAGVLSNRGWLMVALDRREEAVADYQRAIELLRPLLQRDPAPRVARWYLTNTYLRLGQLQRAMDKPDQAATAYMAVHQMLQPLAENGQATLQDKSGLAYSLYGLGVVHLHRRQCDQARQAFDQAATLHEEMTQLQKMPQYSAALIESLCGAVEAVCGLNRYPEALAYVDRAEAGLAALDDWFPEYPTRVELRAMIDRARALVLDGRARQLATHHDPLMRNGTAAVADATRACQLVNWQEFQFVDTLAAAYAEQGDFSKAVEYAAQALELAPDSRRPILEARLTLYQNGQPFHCPPPTDSDG